MRFALCAALVLTAASAGRVEFPEGYREKLQVLRTVEKPGEVKTIYGNQEAASTFGSAPRTFPHGSILVMETLKQGQVTGLHVMRKERTEWEYAEYKPDRSYITPPEKASACVACHLKAGAAKDYVYGVAAGR